MSSRASFFEARFGTISPQLQHVETTVMGLEQGVQSGSPVLQEEVTRAATQLLDLANRIYRDLRSTRDTLTVTVRS